MLMQKLNGIYRRMSTPLMHGTRTKNGAAPSVAHVKAAAMSDNFNFDDVSKESLQREVIRLHRQRVLMACVIRATQPRHDDDPSHLIVDIISELGHIADNINVEKLSSNGWYVEVWEGLTYGVTAALTDYLKDGGTW